MGLPARRPASLPPVAAGAVVGERRHAVGVVVSARLMQFHGFDCTPEPGWPVEIAAVWVSKHPTPAIALLLFAIGADEDVPFAWLPSLRVMVRDRPDKPMVGGQVWLSWLGFVIGWRVDVLPEGASL